MADPLLEDLILNEMPDIGSSHKKAEVDLAAYTLSFFVNNALASLVINSLDEKISIRALKQIHRLTTVNLYRKTISDALYDAKNKVLN
ncbi:unnamed protein product [Rotaria sp. Silwood1]|nr:unnamed protein product [Rotaria sp. Silwood1]CAF1578825.1 unnamed protein product [Rotaria sp. Silwood1]